MKTFYSQTILFLECGLTFVFLILSGCGSKSGSADLPLRLPAVADKFYPAEPGKLQRAVDAFLIDAVPPLADSPKALLVPHAGYIFSAQIAADAFKQASLNNYEVVVVIGPNHTTAGFNKISVYPQGFFRTPLGDVQVEETLARAITEKDDDCSSDLAVHEREHSIEVQLPFIKTLFPQAKIVPIIIGEPDLDKCTRLGRTLAEVLKNRRALVVASSDLSHYPRYAGALEADHRTLAAAVSLDPLKFNSALEAIESSRIHNLSTAACGSGPIMTVLAMMKELGGGGVRIISYANSGDGAMGDRNRAVGYGAAAFFTGKAFIDTTALTGMTALASPNIKPSDKPITLANREKLLHLARHTIVRYLQTGTTPLPRGFPAELNIPRGAFVTLKKNGDLRGCIGHMAEDTPLCQTVCAMAMAAAFQDSRFSPVRESELKDIDIEISALTPMRQVSGPEDFKIGRDGVQIRKRGRSAVYLPQVAVEQGWNREQTLSQLCLKAGLQPDDWKKDTEFYTFQAEVFGESKKVRK